MPSRFLNNININDEYSLPNADGSADQIITTDGAGQLSFVDQSTINAGNAEHVVIYAKNTSGASIAKGTPVYITGTVGATDTVEIAPADAGNAAKMPSVGLLDDTLINNAFGYVITGGFMDNITTDPIDGATPSSNDTVYVKVGGGLTLTKPTGPTGLIQNVAKVGKVSGGNSGSLIVSSILRSNDVPNLTTGKIWVGDGNTVESTVVHLDEVNERMGINTASPLQTLQVNGGVLSTLGLYSDFALASNRNWSIETNTFGAGNWGGIAIKTSTSNGGDPSTARFGIDSSGNVGIGTTSPGEKLEVDGRIKVQTSAGSLTFKELGAGSATIAGSATVGIEAAGNFRVKTNVTNEAFTVLSTGNVGIGTTSPNALLDVSATSNATIRLSSSSANQQGQAIGKIDFYSADTSTPGAGIKSSITTYVESESSAEGDASSMAFSTSNGAVNNVERVRIDKNGNVGIGTTNPSAPLSLGNGGAESLELNHNISSSSRILSYNRSNNTYRQLQLDALEHIFKTSSSEKMRITSGGNVGIGTTSPSSPLNIRSTGNRQIHLSDTSDSTTQGLFLGYDSAGNVLSYIGSSYNSDGSRIDFRMKGLAEGDSKMSILGSGNVGIGTTSPNSRLEVNGEIDANGGDGYKIDGRPWANWGSDLLTLGDWDGEGYATRIMGSNSSEVMRVTGTNVGIGTISPLNKLQVTGGSIGVDSEYIIRDNRNNTILLQSSNTVASNRSLTIGNATYSNITTASNVGIGTSAPSQKLDVTGNALISGTLYINNTSSSIYRFFNELIIQNTASTSISIGGGPGNVTNNLEVNGFVEATASTDAYKGYIKQSVICIATEKQDSTDYFFIPYNTSATSASAQYYNRMVAAYDGRVKKVYIKNTSGTPSADTVNLKKHVNNTTDATEYSATVANAASAGMSAVYNFANNDFTFSEGDNFGVLYQTVNSGGGGRSMAGVTINIIVEYNIT